MEAERNTPDSWAWPYRDRRQHGQEGRTPGAMPGTDALDSRQSSMVVRLAKRDYPTQTGLIDPHRSNGLKSWK
jgi:hypothetical protein